MAARFTEHPGDPAWLQSQRDAQQRARRVAPAPRQKTVVVTPKAASTTQFYQGAKDNSGSAFVLGLVLGAWVGRRR